MPESPDLLSLLEKISPDNPAFKKYQTIMMTFWNVDVSADPVFQKRFNGFYRVRRNAAWQQQFYDVFQWQKIAPTDYDGIVDLLYQKTGLVERSFASKMLATLDPAKPVWDSEVLKKLGYSPYEFNSKSDNERLTLAKQRYREICDWYTACLQDPKTALFLQRFDEKFPAYTWLTPTKKIDFALWSVRE